MEYRKGEMGLQAGGNDSDEHAAIYPNIVVQSLENVICKQNRFVMQGVIYDSVKLTLQMCTFISTLYIQFSA